MKARIIGITAFFAAFIIAVTVYFALSEAAAKPEDIRTEQVIAMNEIRQLMLSGNTDLATEKLTELQDKLHYSENGGSADDRIIIVGAISLAFVIVIFGYIYFAMLRPFVKLQRFADSIAKGDFDIPLQYERFNYFGSFTWAFDSMRREITKARSCEREAIENNKTVIATLSHDIKTPIASIRAYAEGLEANLDSTSEKREKYLSVIMRKCDEVSKLTNDLFLHSLSDLDKLKMQPEEFELCGFIESAVYEMAAEHNDIKFKRPDFTAAVLADKNRLLQITENLINNSRKYAKTDINVSIVQLDGNAEIHFRDHGAGIPDEDMPFIFDKFYRGRNCGKEQGSGLGLYIVKYIAGQMNGSVMLHNHSDGLEAVISLPIINKKIQGS